MSIFVFEIVNKFLRWVQIFYFQKENNVNFYTSNKLRIHKSNNIQNRERNADNSV